MDLYAILQQLTYRKIDIRFFVEKNVEISAWPGAVLRNRFLYAAESILCADGISLRQKLDTLPIPESHPYYNQFKGGFPKGFLFDCSHLPYSNGKMVLRKEHIYRFSLILVGNCINDYPLFLLALERMFNDGIGNPRVQLTLVDCNVTDFNSFNPSESRFHKATELSLTFNTPISLVNPSKIGNGGYQNKLNSFPSFYQFMRSFIYRLVSLTMLYVEPDVYRTQDEVDHMVESYIADAFNPFLLKADITYTKLHSTPRVGEHNVYVMSGYSGALSFDEVPTLYIHLLDHFALLCVGNDINFGLGNFSIKTK